MVEIYLKRKIDTYLAHWKKDTERKPLIVKGARQVGKTESIRRFAEGNYKNIIYINFVEEPKYKMIAEDGYKIDDIIRNISRIDPSKKFEVGETILIFDELQEFPEIATSLKFFKLDGRFDVICSGSMLGIQYKRIESHSVGYKIDYNMMSMDFEEFLWAKGYDSAAVEDMLWHMKAEKPFNEIVKSDSYPDIKYSIKFISGNIGYSDKIYTFPYFCAFLLKDYLKEMSLERESIIN